MNRTGRYLTKLGQTYLSRCMAMIGSGTYELKKMPEQQISVLRSMFLDAKDKGADWELIYSAIYELWSPQRPLLPSPEEMAIEITSGERTSKQEPMGKYAEELASRSIFPYMFVCDCIQDSIQAELNERRNTMRLTEMVSCSG